MNFILGSFPLLNKYVQIKSWIVLKFSMYNSAAAIKQEAFFNTGVNICGARCTQMLVCDSDENVKLQKATITV